MAPTWHNGECPRALDALILRLLAKDPSERPESATDVLAALEAIDLTTSVEQPAAGVDSSHALDSLAGGVFVGRQREMGELKACLEDALSGRGRLVTLVGEPGIGKTRTAQELATYAGLRGAQVLWGRSYEEQGVPPYWPWVQAIALAYATEGAPGWPWRPALVADQYSNQDDQDRGTAGVPCQGAGVSACDSAGDQGNADRDTGTDQPTSPGTEKATVTGLSRVNGLTQWRDLGWGQGILGFCA